LIALQLLLKRVEDVSEEALDADGIYVILHNQWVRGGGGFAQVTLGNSVSSKRVTKGCPQGSVSGPTLWNIIVNDLIALHSNAPNVRMVVFADNIMIMIQGPSLSTIFTTLQSTLQTIEDWCKEYRLEISKDKSALMPMFI